MITAEYMGAEYRYKAVCIGRRRGCHALGNRRSGWIGIFSEMSVKALVCWRSYSRMNLRARSKCEMIGEFKYAGDANSERHSSGSMVSQKEYEKEVRADLAKVGALCAVILGLAGLLFVFFDVP